MPRVACGLAAALLMAVALAALFAGERGLAVGHARLGPTPVTVYAPNDAGPAPAVVVAHGFAGSGRLMAQFATTLARAGYLAVTYDALGHGRNPAPLTGDVAAETGATAALLAELGRVAEFARTHPGSDGRLALVGHSMASDIVIRAAVARPEVAATVAVSMFSPVVTATEPRNLLVVTGALEAGLTDAAIAAAELAAGGRADPSVTYGDPAAGTGRRAVLPPRVEHVGVLYHPLTLRETVAWLNATFGREAEARPDRRGPWFLAYAFGFVALAWAAAPLLPRVAAPAPPRPLQWPRFALAALAPAVLAPLAATAAAPRLLPMPLADHLLLHFALYGLLTGLIGWRLGALAPRGRAGPLAVAAAALAAFTAAGLYLPIDRFITVFLPEPHRLALLLPLALGLLPFFLADEALTRGPAAPRFAYPLTKLAFLLSLALAIALAPERLFFLVIIFPVVLAFFLLFGLLGRWTARATGSPWPAALAQALLFAWAIAVTLPLLATS